MLDISLGLLVLTAVIFFILLFLLNSWLYQPLLRFMQERDESIARDLENADTNEDVTKKLLQEAQDVVAQAKSEASRMKSEAIEVVKAEVAVEIEKKKAELEKRYEAFVEELKKEEEVVRSTLISQMPLFKEALKAKFNTL